jgi:hypothetical protein
MRAPSPPRPAPFMPAQADPSSVVQDFLASMIAEFMVGLVRGAGYAIALTVAAAWLHAHAIL